MRAVSGILLVLLVALARPASAETWAFVHRATADNTPGAFTVLDHPALNGQPDRVVLVTPRWIPHRYDLVEAARPLAVAYDRTRSRWTVATAERGSSLHPPVEFNVVAMPPSAEAWVHSTGAGGDCSLLDRARGRGVLVFATPAEPDEHPVGVLYDEVAGAWALVHRDGAPMAPSVRYHVWIVPRGLEVEGVARATADGEAPVTAGAPTVDSVILCAANWSPEGALAPASRGFEAVAWDGSRWVVRGRAMPEGSAYNTVVLFSGRVAGGPTVPVAPPPPAPARLRVRAVDAAGTPVAGAEVFLDNVAQPGRTAANGEIQVTVPPGGAREILVRKMARENGSWLRRHEGGSVAGRNWSHRVWRWNYDPVSGRGAAIGDPSQVQVVRLDRTLIGLHLVVSMNWDANRRDWEWTRGQFEAASDHLFHATDGQFFFERVEIGDNSHAWSDYVADVRVWADYTARPIVWNRAGGMTIPWEGNYAPINLSRASGAGTIVHEFGHYGFALTDEYQDADPNAGCTAGLDRADAAFARNGPAASCLMFNHGVAGKFCSNDPENQHHLPGRSGRWYWLAQVDPCWTVIQRMFEKPGEELLSPDERAGIPGAVVRPPFVAAELVVTDTDLPGLLQDPEPLRLGRRDVNVWVEHRHGPHTAQGRTLTYRAPGERSWFNNTTDPTMDGSLWLAGLHVGDRIVWGGANNWNSRVVTASGWSPVARAEPPGYSGALAAEVPGTAVDPGRQDSPFDLFVTLEPTARGTCEVVVETSAKATATPKVTLSGGQIPTLAAKGDLFTATMALQARNLLLKAEALVGGEKVERFVPVAVSPLSPKWESTSYSGDLSLVVNAEEGSFVALTPGDVDPPEGCRTVSGPFRVAVSGGHPYEDGPLPGPGWLRFRLPEGGAPPDAAAMRVLRYDRAAKAWQDLGGTWLPEVAIVSAQVEREGNYALVVPGAPGPASAWMASALPNGPGAVRLVAGGALPATLLVEDLQGRIVAELKPALEGPPEKPDLVAYANGLTPGATYRARVRSADGALSEALEFRVEEQASPKDAPAPDGLRVTGIQALGGGAVALEGAATLPSGGEVVFLVFGPQGEWVATSETLRVPPGAGSPVSATMEGLQPGVPYSVLLVTVDRSAESAPFPVLLEPGK